MTFTIVLYPRRRDIYLSFFGYTSTLTVSYSPLYSNSKLQSTTPRVSYSLLAPSFTSICFQYS